MDVPPVDRPSLTDLPAGEAPSLQQFTAFLRHICRLLMECGCSSNRVEMLTQLLGESWGYEVDTIAIPTGVWLAVRSDTQQVMELTRVKTWSVDLDRLARLNELVDLVHSRRLSLSEAHQRLTAELSSKPPYPKALTILAGGCASTFLVFNYGGAPSETLLGLPAGMLVLLISKYLFSGGERRYLGDFTAAAAVALFAYLCRATWPWVDAPRLIIGGLVVNVPGLVLVNAVHEVAQKNLVSGAAKFLEALVITASLVCGVVFVVGLLRLCRLIA